MCLPERESGCIVRAVTRQGSTETGQAPRRHTQASDAPHRAGFLYGWLSGESLRGCLELGIVCGSISTLEVGGTVGQPTLERAREAVAGWRRLRTA